MIKNYCKICATLLQSDIEKIEKISETVSILSNMLNLDVFIDCPTKDKNKAIVVYHARPKKNSLYSKNIAGAVAEVGSEPAVFRSFITGQTSKNYKAKTQEEREVFQNVMPLFNKNKEVIGVIIVEYIESSDIKFNSEFFNKTAKKLIREIDISRTKIPEFVKDGIIVLNHNGIVSYVNKVAVKLYAKLGFSKNIIGEHFQNIVLTKTSISNILKYEKNINIEVNISNMILMVSYFVTMLDDNKPNIIMVIRDITKEKMDEQEIMEKSYVIKEIHHRVKNNLQTIASLLRIQKRRVENEEMKQILDDTINRILSIAVTHETLSKNGIDNLNIKTIIQLLYEHSFKNTIEKMQKLEFKIIGDDFVVSSDKATSVALVVNELIQNAVKYAFVGKTSGKITIIIHKKRFVTKIVVADNGVGMNLEKTRDNSLGLTIVKKLIIDKLDGSFNLYSRLGKGTRVEFEIKNN